MAKYYSETSPAWAGVQTGTIAMMPKDSGGNYYAPDGWLECNGRGLNPNEYVGLYNVIENTYGGSTTGTFPSLSGDFNVPDLRDRRVVGTGRLRPDNTSPELEQHDAGSTNNCGTRGGKNNITLSDISSRVQVTTGSIVSTFNTSRTDQIPTAMTDGYLQVQSGFLSNYTMPSWPGHKHVDGVYNCAPAGSMTTDWTSPGSGDTGILGGASAATTYSGANIQAVGGSSEPHSHWISFKSSISGTFSYHKGFGDSIGSRGQNAGNPAPGAYNGNDWYEAYCVAGSSGGGGSGGTTSWQTVYGPAYSAGQAYVSLYQGVFTYVYQGVTQGTITLGSGQSEPVENGGKRFYGGSLAVNNGNSWNQPDYYQIRVQEQQTSGGSETGSADAANEGVIDITTGSCTIKPPATDMQWTIDDSPVDGTQITFDLDVDLDLDGTPDLKPQYQQTAYMIFGGVNSSVYTAPPQGDTGDRYPDQVGPFNIGVTTASGNATVTFDIDGVDSNYSFDIEVTKIGGESTSGSPINLQGTNGATNTGYGLGDTVIMTLEAPSNGGTTANYQIAVKYNTSTVMTALANITYEAAPSLTISAQPSNVASGATSVITYSCPGATAIVSSNFGASTPTGGTVNVNPSATTTYTLEVSNQWGNTSESTTVSVAAANAPSITMTVTPSSVAYGASATVSYSCGDATGFVSASSSPTDSNWDNAATTAANTAYFSRAVSPTATTDYSVTLSNANGNATKTETLTVAAAPAPTASLTASSSSIVQGSPAGNMKDTDTLLSWTTSNSNNVYGTSTPTDSSWNPTTSSGTFTATPSQTTTYSIYAEALDGGTTISSQQTITVIQQPQITVSATRAYTPAVGSQTMTATSTGLASTTVFNYVPMCVEETITINATITGTADTTWGGCYWGVHDANGYATPLNSAVDTNLGYVGSSTQTVQWQNIKPMPTENGVALGGKDAVSTAKEQGIFIIQASNSAGQVARAGFRFAALKFKISRASNYQDTIYTTGSNFGIGNTPQTAYNFSTYDDNVANASWKYMYPALINAGTTWTVTSMKTLAGNSSHTAELFGNVENGVMYVEDLPITAPPDWDFMDIFVECNVADWSGPTPARVGGVLVQGRTAITDTFSITIPGSTVASIKSL
tara:strand:- start:2468 stop:5875 length:3408 start_codon:yes stop_codon:yes gene_type:complete